MFDAPGRRGGQFSMETARRGFPGEGGGAEGLVTLRG